MDFHKLHCQLKNDKVRAKAKEIEARLDKADSIGVYRMPVRNEAIEELLFFADDLAEKASA